MLVWHRYKALCQVHIGTDFAVFLQICGKIENQVLQIACGLFFFMFSI